MSKRKVIAVIVSLCVIICVLLQIQWIYMDVKAMELSQQGAAPYSMLSNRLKSIVSEEEFNCETDNDKYKMYLKFQNVEYVQPPKRYWSTDMFKTPPRFEVLKTDESDFCVEFLIDYRICPWKIEIINFVPEIYN